MQATEAASTTEDAGTDAAGPQSPFAGGAGTEASPYQIANCAQLQAMSTALYDHFVVTADIDCTGFDAGDGHGFRPVGDDGLEFGGRVDGGGHVVTGLTIDRPTENRVGLFGRTRWAVITRLGLVSPHITGKDDVGALIGWQRWGLVEQVFVRGGTVAGRQRVGALVGQMHHSKVYDSYAQAEMSCSKWDSFSGGGQSRWNRDCGHLVGSTVHGTVLNSYAAVLAAPHYGLAGGSSPCTHTASFYDCEIVAGCTAPHTEARATSLLQSQAYLEGQAWDFESVWGLQEATYPCLQWEAGCGEVVCASDDASCDGADDDCDGAVDEDYVSTPTSCGVGVCGATGATSCVDGAVQDSCAPGSATGADALCDGLDDDCDGVVDEGYVATETTCGEGVCGASGATSCVDGAVQDSCAPGSATGDDANCDGVDDDCDGSTDEGYVSIATSCGEGVCGATGATSCVSGTVQDSCAPGTATGADTLCDGVDEDCDGSTDEGYVSAATSCGVGVCGATGATSCVSGAVQDSCAPGAVTGADTVCDGLDEDCDGSTDEAYVSAATTCGVGACGATGATSCVSGAVQDSCAPGAATGADTVCDGVDEDCDGSTDEGYVSAATSCGAGVCGATGATSCVSGAVQDSCAPGAATGTDSVCDGLDEDCDGSTDEGYASTATTCGVGVCGATGATSCVGGAVQDSCAPGTGTGADTVCDGVDDDCDGSTDEGYASTATTCGVGVCGATGATSCVSGTVQDSCAPGTATGADTACDGLDEDCDGSTDEGYASMTTTCGLGVCGATGATSCVSGAVQDSCAPGAATGADTLCDGVDEDCDGSTDEGYVSAATSCGAGVCGATGATSCVSGTVQDSCAPGTATGADTVCDGLDEDCDGSTDEGYASMTTTCGLGVCGATGATSCVSGAVQDSCAPGAATGADTLCDGVDEDCDGSTDEGYVSAATSCGAGVCGATGATSCVSGAVQDSCAPGAATGTDSVCDGLDEDCDGSTDEGYASTTTSCGVGVCGATGATSCVGGAVQDSCAPGTATGADTVCDGVDEDCDGSTDEGYASTATTCGVGVCGATGATSCVSGTVQDSCAPGTATGADTVCDGLDEDCDGSTDEGYASMTTTAAWACEPQARRAV
ncbi:MAG: MopE-related protein [Polyangiales bacterium]